MAPRWPSLDLQQQADLIGKITDMFLEALPAGWEELAIDYRVVGRTIDLATGLRQPDGSYRAWVPPDEPIRQFQRLRGGMYLENEGTWFSMRYILTPPARTNVVYNSTNEPDFNPYPAPEEFLLEQERFPRLPGYQPRWYAERLAAAVR